MTQEGSEGGASDCIFKGRLGKLCKHLFDRKQRLLTNCGRTGNRLKLNKSKQLGCQIKLNQLATLHYEAAQWQREIGIDKGARERGRVRGKQVIGVCALSTLNMLS